MQQCVSTKGTENDLIVTENCTNSLALAFSTVTCLTAADCLYSCSSPKTVQYLNGQVLEC